MNTPYPRPKWLDNAVFYEIYPQSFQDSNGDGIGDIPGIISRLDYLKELGVDALWLNPLFDSPFKDAGYDVRDYKLVAPRYGTNEDLVRLFDQAHARGIRVLLDLVPGHTSEEHAWFQSSSRPEPNEFSDRYVWTDSWIAGGDGYPFIGGETERDGTYILNFFKCQPALNYGWAHPKYPWQDPALGPTARKTCDAMVDVMRFWLSLGADGFRVDMANSLVKHDDEGKPYTIKTWHYMFDQIRPEFPEAAFVAEWGVPSESVQAGFDMDFYLDWRWDNHPNGYNILLRNTNTPYVRENDLSYFNADTSTSICGFLEQYEPQLRAAEKSGAFFSLITCNHDTWRVAPRLTERELSLAWATILTCREFRLSITEMRLACATSCCPPKRAVTCVPAPAPRCSGIALITWDFPRLQQRISICRSTPARMLPPWRSSAPNRILCGTRWRACWNTNGNSRLWRLTALSPSSAPSRKGVYLFSNAKMPRKA